MYVRAHICLCMFTWGSEMDTEYLPQSFFTLFSEERSLTNLEHPDSSRLSGQQAPGMLSSLISCVLGW